MCNKSYIGLLQKDFLAFKILKLMEKHLFSFVTCIQNGCPSQGQPPALPMLCSFHRFFHFLRLILISTISILTSLGSSSWGSHRLCHTSTRAEDQPRSLSWGYREHPSMRGSALQPRAGTWHCCWSCYEGRRAWERCCTPPTLSSSIIRREVITLPSRNHSLALI